MTLSTLGQALFGTSWQTDLSRATGVQLRTMQRWVVGKGTPPPGFWRDAARLCRARAKALVKIAEELERR